ncbi:hypothetical protein [Aquimarina megaterium]|uniref:hypothetical protein n=1 Tax=Aquimarina megaterium TaxID=1443666 RepID=UPI00046E8629|nr:hypothetical protein [Aquimarina megaterium]
MITLKFMSSSQLNINSNSFNFEWLRIPVCIIKTITFPFTEKLHYCIKYLFLTPIVLLLFSCQQPGNEIELPSSSFSNFDIKKNTKDYFISVKQLTDKKYQIIYRDTIVARLDSTLHSKIIDLKESNRGYHEYPSIMLSLDKNLPYDDYKELTTEFRKLYYHRFVLKLGNHEHFRTYMFPYQKIENKYLEPRISTNKAPSIYNEFRSYFEENKYVIFSLKNESFIVNDSKGNLIEDYVEYALQHKKFITFYTLHPSATYQDYIDLISHIESLHTTIKDTIEHQTNITYQELNDTYMFALMEEMYLQHYSTFDDSHNH